MGFLLKFAIAGVVGYMVWTGVRRLLGLSNQRPPAPPPVSRSGAEPQPRPRTVVEDTVQCRICGSFVSTSAAKCGRQDCPLSA